MISPKGPISGQKMVTARSTKPGAQRRDFGRDRAGNIAILWAIMGATLVGLLGLSVDFTRGQSLRVRMQNAADGAALVAERLSNRPLAQRTQAARAFFDAEMGEYANDANFLVVEMNDGGHRVTADLDMDLSLAKLIENDDWTIRVSAEAMANASPPIEVVLALDNTGSMADDMDTLREGAQTLVEFLMSLDGDSVKVGLVPFVAQVNVGTDAQLAGWMDTTGTNPHHGEFFEGRYIGRRNTVSGACTNAASFPATFGGYPVTWVQGAVANPGTAYDDTGRCYAFANGEVNLFNVYANLPAAAQWRGCVEARPEPYDINDDPPTAAIPATRWVPFFSPDEGGDDTANNNWITNTTYDRADTFGLGGGFTAAADNRTLAIYKYRAGVPVTVQDNGATTSDRGPNRGCPTPIVPLTTNEAQVVSAVQNMEHWYGGGTNQIEGMAWAWRVISPGAPFTEGRPYNDPNDPVRKVIVLFTDGDNTSLNSGNNGLESDYAAFNSRRLWREFQYQTWPTTGGSPGIPAASRRVVAGLNAGAPNTNDSGDMVAYMNDRQEALCDEIKAAGVEVYTIGFGITPGGAADQLLEFCATDADHYFQADSQQEMLEAFDAIGSGIGDLRLTQ
jgi:Flp pilus assembly protein TadG